MKLIYRKILDEGKNSLIGPLIFLARAAKFLNPALIKTAVKFEIGRFIREKTFLNETTNFMMVTIFHITLGFRCPHFIFLIQCQPNQCYITRLLLSALSFVFVKKEQL
jgi:hypothetical protein